MAAEFQSYIFSCFVTYFKTIFYRVVDLFLNQSNYLKFLNTYLDVIYTRKGLVVTSLIIARAVRTVKISD